MPTTIRQIYVLSAIVAVVLAANAPAQATLFASWDLNGSFNSSNSTYNGIATSSVTFVAGQVGLAANFPGGSGTGDYNPGISYVDSIGTTTAATFNGGFSIVSWVNWNPAGGSTGAFFSHDSSGSGLSFLGYQLTVQPDGSVFLMMRDASDHRLDTGTSANVVPANTWVQIAVTWNGSTSGGTAIYLNGVAVDTTVQNFGGFTGITETEQMPFRIGSSYADSLNNIYGFSGSLSDVSIWQGALTPTEIQTTYDSQIPEPSTVSAILGLTALCVVIKHRRSNRNSPSKRA